MKKLLTLVLTLTMTLSLAACGNDSNKEQSNDPDGDAASIVYAVEAGSAGESVANEKGFQVNSVTSQADALMEVQSGTSDAAIIDSLMAGAMVGEGTSYPNLKVTDQKLTSEYYGVGCRQGSDLAPLVTALFAELDANGTLAQMAETYGVQDALLPQADAEQIFQKLVEDTEAEVEETVEGDLQYIKDKGTLIVGMTEFEPMDYKNDKGEWIGFDADLAKQVAKKLGVEVQFLVIDWDRQLEELNSKNVDILWNGMTLNQARLSTMNCSVPYCNNAQVVVTK